MSDWNAVINEFFSDYERTNAEFDVERIAAFYADVFMFADSQGAHSVKKEDF